MLAAAYLFVFQLVLGSLALSVATANAVPLDSFGNPLCITHSESSGSDHRDSSKLPECCTQACSMFAPLLASASTGHFIANRLEPVGQVFVAERFSGPFKRPETDPGNPRAPPLAA